MALNVTNGERALTVEMLISIVLVFVYTTRKGGALPNPRQFAGLFFAYGMLALLSAFGEQPAKLAGAFGLLVLMIIAVATVGELGGALTSAVDTKNNPVHLDQTKSSAT